MNNLEAPKHRKQLRLKYYDYSQNGAYYVTICTHNRINLFGKIINVGAHPCVRLSTAGAMIKKKLLDLEQKFPDVTVDYYCVMPNHLYFVNPILHEFCFATILFVQLVQKVTGSCNQQNSICQVSSSLSCQLLQHDENLMLQSCLHLCHNL